MEGRGAIAVWIREVKASYSAQFCKSAVKQGHSVVLSSMQLWLDGACISACSLQVSLCISIFHCSLQDSFPPYFTAWGVLGQLSPAWSRSLS